MIEVEDIYFSYGKRRILNGVSFSIERGQFICVLGENGCGKTTLLKLMLGLLKPEKGRITLYGQDIRQMTERELAKKVAYIPQSHTPPFPFEVMDVVLMGRTPHLSKTCRPTAGDIEIARQSLERLGILEYADKRYTELSGGQRQMVIIARALTQQPDLLIMDEPTASLDFGNQYLVLTQMLRLAAEGLSVLMVTHDPDHALYCADQIIAMKDGRIIRQGETKAVISEPTMESVYRMTVKVRNVRIGPEKSRAVCVPVPELTERLGGGSGQVPGPSREVILH